MMKSLLVMGFSLGLALGGELARYDDLNLACFEYTTSAECLDDPGLLERCVWENSRCKCGLTTPTDVIFLFDRNDNTLMDRDFESQREWVAESIYSDIPPESRVGIIEFANEAASFMSLDWSASQTAAERRDRAYELTYEMERFDSVTGEALDMALDMFANTPGSSSRRQVIVIITTKNPTCGGCAADDPKITPCTRNAQLQGISVVTLAGHTSFGGLDETGIAALQCLDDSKDDYFQEFNGFGSSTFEYNVRPTINAGTCPVKLMDGNDCPPHKPDVAYVIDSSSSLGQEDFATVLSWIGGFIIEALPRDTSRAAFVRFSTDSEILRTFPQSGAGTREEDYMESLLIDQNRGETNTYEAMLDAISLFEEVEQDSDRQRIMVLLTDGEPNPENSLLCGTKSRFEELGVTSIVFVVDIYSVGVAEEVKCLADYIKTVHDYSEASYEEILELVKTVTCNPPTTTESPTSTTESDTSNGAGDTFVLVHLDEAKSFSEANAFCEEEYGTTLAIIEDLVANQRFWDSLAIYSTSAWFGFADMANADDFDWVDANPTAYVNWDLGEPTDLCVQMLAATGTWKDVDCAETTKAFFCEASDELSEATAVVRVDGAEVHSLAVAVSSAEAHTYCQSQGAELYSVIDEADNARIQKAMNALALEFAFFGLETAAVSYKWLDGRSLDFDLWADGQPLESQFSLMRASDGKWLTACASETVSAVVCTPTTVTTTTVTSTTETPTSTPTSTATPSYSYLAIEEVFPAAGDDWSAYTYDDFVQLAQENGGRLATQQEIIDNNIIGESAASDQWVPVSNRRDWVQIKDERLHLSHVDDLLIKGYPEWGDSRTSQLFRGNSFVIARTVIIEEVFPEAAEDWHSFTYDDFVSLAQSHDGRLATQQEIIEANIIGASDESAEQWVPVSNRRDWVKIKGSENLHGSHVDLFNYPQWGDDGTYTYHHGNSFVIARTP